MLNVNIKVVTGNNNICYIYPTKGIIGYKLGSYVYLILLWASMGFSVKYNIQFLMEQMLIIGKVIP